MLLCLYRNDTVAKVVELNQTAERSGTKRRHATYKRKSKRLLQEQKERKVMRRQYTENIDRQLISEEKNINMTIREDLKAETLNE
jgi:hypothetical protein